jgi:hypothetical protein
MLLHHKHHQHNQDIQRRNQLNQCHGDDAHCLFQLQSIQQRMVLIHPGIRRQFLSNERIRRACHCGRSKDIV